MNWRKLYATLQIWTMVGMLSFVTAGCNAVVVIGICRIFFGWNDEISVFGVGLPAFLAMFFVFFKHLPKPLRNAGMLSDDPKKFGPWFK
ncbi:hypothetical protein [Pandoraea sputorum]|uniref:hypothetical protein n=1 Tax=Pandoraea sputorum TaxID=93222 RepID=UPI002AF6B3C7|nr:hypothetical protein [Pandoraea sputorum]